MRRSGGLGWALGTPRAGNARACCVHSEDSPRAVRPSRVTMPPCNASRVVQDDPTARGAPVGCALAPGWLVSEVGAGASGATKANLTTARTTRACRRHWAGLGRQRSLLLLPDDGPLPPACRKAKRVLQKTQSRPLGPTENVITSLQNPPALQKTQSTKVFHMTNDR